MSPTSLSPIRFIFSSRGRDACDFEYIFHTHPSTPIAGARVKEGILYEFPSIPDLEQFIDHYNNGVTQGSIIFAPEGLYIIKCIDNTKKIIIKKERKVFNYILKKFYEIQDSAIYKYGIHFSTNEAGFSARSRKRRCKPTKKQGQ